jgi:hypothetical protein
MDWSVFHPSVAGSHAPYDRPFAATSSWMVSVFHGPLPNGERCDQFRFLVDGSKNAQIVCSNAATLQPLFFHYGPSLVDFNMLQVEVARVNVEEFAADAFPNPSTSDTFRTNGNLDFPLEEVCHGITFFLSVAANRGRMELQMCIQGLCLRDSLILSGVFKCS